MKMRYFALAAVIVVVAVIAIVGTHPWGTTAGEMEGKTTTPSDVNTNQ
jgi:hypothetical protein